MNESTSPNFLSTNFHIASQVWETCESVPRVIALYQLDICFHEIFSIVAVVVAET